MLIDELKLKKQYLEKIKNKETIVSREGTENEKGFGLGYGFGEITSSLPKSTSKILVTI